MRKGIVMAEGRRGPVVLTPDGEFVEVPGLTGEVGEEIGFGAPLRRTVPLHRRLLLAASAAAVLLLVAAGLARLPVFDGSKVAAYVAIDINPSVEIGVDRKRTVVELQALNADGERVIEGVAYKRRPVGDVAADIIRNAEAAEYLRDGGEVFVTSMAAADVDGQFEDELVREIDRAVHEAALHPGEETKAGAERSGSEGKAEKSGSDAGSEGTAEKPGSSAGAGSGTEGSGKDAGARSAPDSGPAAGSDRSAASSGGTDAVTKREPAASSARNIAVTIVRAPGELRETAKANGISPGKMAVYLLAEKQGLPISLDDLKQGSIHQAVEPYGGVSGLLGDGRSDDERKRELAELLAKEAAAKAKGKSAESAGDKKAAADGGKKASAGSGKPASASGGKNRREQEKEQKEQAAKQDRNRQEQDIRQNRAGRTDQAGGLEIGNRTGQNVARAERDLPEFRDRRNTWEPADLLGRQDRKAQTDRQAQTARERNGRQEAAGRGMREGQTRNPQTAEARESKRQDRDRQQALKQEKTGQARQEQPKNRQAMTQQKQPEKTRQEERKNQREERRNPQENKKQNPQTKVNANRQAMAQQKQQEQARQKQQAKAPQKRQEPEQQKRSGNDRGGDDGNRMIGPNGRVRQDEGERNAERQRDERRTGSFVQWAALLRTASGAGASDGAAGPNVLPV